MGICFLHGQTGGGAEFNLKLVGGIEEPANPGENTVWVKTDVPISGYVLSATEPESGTEGLVWLKTADTGTEINVGKKNALLLRLANSKLYTSGVWKSFDGYVYVSGQWSHFSSTSPTPDEYQDVEFIGVSGTQYINTGMIAEKQMCVEIDFSTGANITNEQYLLSSAGGGNNRVYIPQILSGKGVVMIGDTTHRASFDLSVNTRYDDLTIYVGASASESYLQVGGVKTTFYGLGSMNTSPLLIFARTGPNSYMAGGKLFRLKIHKSGELVADFVPCYRILDNVAGLYDIVRNAFYTNAGTGSFILGKDV